MINAAPTTGSNAASPGNGVPLSYDTAASRIPASPSHDSDARIATLIRASTGALTAISTPTPSSQLRASVEKYAPLGSAAVWCTDHASEMPTPTATRTDNRRSTTASTPRPRGEHHERERQQQRPDQVELLLDRQRPEVL